LPGEPLSTSTPLVASFCRPGARNEFKRSGDLFVPG
jgi:hypothetical protein